MFTPHERVSSTDQQDETSQFDLETREFLVDWHSDACCLEKVGDAGRTCNQSHIGPECVSVLSIVEQI